MNKLDLLMSRKIGHKPLDKLCACDIIKVWKSQDVPVVEVVMCIIGKRKALFAEDAVMSGQ